MVMPWESLTPGPFGRHAGQVDADPMWIWCDSTGYRDVGGLPAAGPAELWLVVERDNGFDCELHHPGSLQDFTAAELAMPVLPQRMRLRQAPSDPVPAGDYTPSDQSKVLVGIIDSGCPFASPMLRDGNGGTRVLGLWDQDDAPAFAAGGFRPEGVRYGRAIGRAELNALMGLAAPNGRLDEARCYGLAGCSSLRFRESHGPAVVGQLFGRSLHGGSLQRRPGRPPRWDRPDQTGPLAIDQADLVFVDIPRTALQDASSAALARYIVDGLRFILGHAVAGQRVVVNISTGTSRTNHDGSSIIERALRRAVQAAGRRGIELHIVLPAGNGNMEQRHARLREAGRALTLFIPPACESPQYVTVRWPAGQSGVSLRVTPPGGAPQEVKPGEAFGLMGRNGPCAGVVSPKPADGKPARSLLAFCPTASFDSGVPVAPSGRWRIELVVPPGVTLLEPVRFWISRNQRNPGALPRGRQSDFIDTGRRHQPHAWLRYDEDDNGSAGDGISRHGAASGLATAAQGHEDRIWVVGSVFAVTPDQPSPYSADGPDGGDLPQRSAPGDASRALRGLSMRGRLGGEVLRMVGTSFAAPLFARALVNGVVNRETPPARRKRRLGEKLIRPD
ncbi:hypothetical protein [Ideonella sp. YS5]|uniref:hypothetical protein n=1 Tax=Ideonella sp. YS5 TaxID=3453714 RepID=UPI003EEAB724